MRKRLFLLCGLRSLLKLDKLANTLAATGSKSPICEERWSVIAAIKASIGPVVSIGISWYSAQLQRFDTRVKVQLSGLPLFSFSVDISSSNMDRTKWALWKCLKRAMACLQLEPASSCLPKALTSYSFIARVNWLLRSWSLEEDDDDDDRNEESVAEDMGDPELEELEAARLLARIIRGEDLAANAVRTSSFPSSVPSSCSSCCILGKASSFLCFLPTSFSFCFFSIAVRASSSFWKALSLTMTAPAMSSTSARASTDSTSLRFAELPMAKSLSISCAMQASWSILNMTRAAQVKT
mmetsp:Transcript_122814/g.347173  ORF Transcript_122814/g.347173 Transcript_122814/m.347173 type:complete len:296 (-) Transcript_122814:485-1372(-)